MARIRIADISRDTKLSKEDLKKVMGGFIVWENLDDFRVKPLIPGDKANQIGVE